MATTIEFKLKGNIINPPFNWKETAFELNFDRDGNAKQRIVSENFEFVRENAATFNAIVTEGASGTGGILEGLPFEVSVSRNGVTEIPFDGYIDLTENADFSPESVNVKATEKKSIEWLERVADGFSFEYLKGINVITTSDYKFMPYVINSIPDYKEAAIAILSAYIVYEQIRETIQKIKELVADLSNPLTSISAVLKASLIAIYIITLITALVKLIKDITQLIIQPVKYHACMNVKTLLEKGCSHLGLTLSSSILSSTVFQKAYIMPEKYQNPVNATDNRILGFTIAKPLEQEGFYKGTFGDLLRAIKMLFKAKIVIRNDVLYLEREDYNITPPQYIVPAISKYQPKYETNANEFKANWYGAFQTDTIEKNTLQEYSGTAYQVVLKPNQTNGNFLGKGLEDVRFPFALAKRKTELSVPEKIIKAFLDALSLIINALISAVNALISGLNSVIKLINKVLKALATVGIKITFQVAAIPSIPSVNLGNIIENRINMMKLETDHTSVPKIFLMDLGSQNKFNKLTTGNETYFSCSYLWENYHFIGSFLPSATKPNGNQYIIRNFTNVPFGFDDFQKVKNNNQVSFLEQDAIIQSLTWNPYDQTAEMRVRISTLLTKNINATYINPDGK